MRLDEIEAPLRALDTLPRNTWHPTLANSVATPAVRVPFVVALHAALLDGRLPEVEHDNGLALCFQSGFRSVIGQLNLTAITQAHPESAEQVVKTLLWHLDRIADYRDAFGEDLSAATQRAVSAFVAEWRDIAQDWQTVFAVFDSFGGLDPATDPSALKGVLARAGWAQVLQMHALIAQLPNLKALIQALGRRVPVPTAQPSEPVPVVVEVEAQASVIALEESPLPQQGAQFEAIHRSADIAAMLPTESVLMRHPILRKLWRARYAEHGLLAYERSVNVAAPRMTHETRRLSQRVLQPPPQLEAGPIIVCVDSSSSMRGAKEWITKAVVFEAMRCAHAGKRPCYLYVFSDEASVTEHLLALTVNGITQLVDFLECSFHGGTDVAEPISRALERVASAQWRHADILIASDGEFGVTPAVQQDAIRAKRELELRVRGVLVGDRETIGMKSICDDIEWIRDWRQFEAAAEHARSPVHARNLTAMYFPNAMKG